MTGYCIARTWLKAPYDHIQYVGTQMSHLQNWTSFLHCLVRQLPTGNATNNHSPLTEDSSISGLYKFPTTLPQQLIRRRQDFLNTRPRPGGRRRTQ